MDYVILTFPRCGSHYLQQLISQNTGLFIDKTHSSAQWKKKKIISIIRNPEDTFKSMVAMQMHYGSNEMVGFGLPIKEYQEFYENLIDSDCILISYNDLVSSPDRVVKAIARRLNLQVNEIEYENLLFDKPDYKHLVSSKTSDKYEKINLSKFDLSKCNDIYSRALLKCITI